MTQPKDGFSATMAAAARDFLEQQGLNQSSSLAFYALLSLIPLLFLAALAVAAFSGGTGEVEEVIRQGIAALAPWLRQAAGARLDDLIRLSPRLGWHALALIVWASGLLFSALLTNLRRPYGQGALPSGWRRVLPWLAGPVAGSVLIGLLVFIQYLGFVSSDLLADSLTRTIYWFSKLWAFLGLTAFFLCLYLTLPGRRALGAASLLSLFLAAASHALTYVFSRFLTGMPDYGAVYGSLAGTVLFLVWVDYNMALILFGGHFLRLWEARSRKCARSVESVEDFVRRERPRQFFEEE